MPVSRLWRLLRWVWHDLIVAFRTHVFLHAATMVTHLGTQLLAFGIVLWYARALEDGRSVDLFGNVLVARDSSELLVAVTLTALILLILSAGLLYVVEGIALSVRKRYSEICFRRCLDLMGRLPDPRAPRANSYLACDLLPGGGTAEARHCGRLSAVVLNMLAPFGAVATYGAVLLYLNPVLTGLIIGILALSGWRLLAIARQAVAGSRLRDELSGSANRKRRRLAAYVLNSAFPVDLESSQVRDILEDPDVQSYEAGYLDYFEKSARSRLTTNLTTAAAILAVVLIAGTSIVTRQTWSVGVLLVYLMALRALFRGLSQIARLASSLTRIYPSIDRYRAFITDAEEAREPGPVGWRWEMAPTLRLSSPDGTGQSPLELGPVTLVVHNYPPGRRLAALVECCVDPGPAERGACCSWVGDDLDWSVGVSLRDHLRLPADSTDASLRAMIEALVPGRYSIPELDVPLSEEAIGNIPRPVRVALRLTSVLHLGRPFLLLTCADWSALDASSVPGVLKDARLLLTCSSVREADGVPGETVTLVTAGKGLLAATTLDQLREDPEALAEPVIYAEEDDLIDVP